MPRRSAADLAVIPGLSKIARLKPPRDLTAAQKSHFAALVAARPADHFQPADMPLLVALARHLARADQVEVLTAQAATVADFDQASKLAARETGRIVSLMTRLRLTPQARYTPDSARLRKRAGGGIEALLGGRDD